MSLLPLSRNGRRLSGAQPGDATSPSQANADSLTLRQALTITAGMAGLVGLLGGALIRFSLASSPNTRFLSPSQTFPTLSDWPSADTSEAPSGVPGGSLENPRPETTEVFPFEEDAAPQEDEDAWQEDLPGTEPWDEEDELNWQTNEDFDTFRSERFTSAPAPTTTGEAVPVPSTFDAFANRSAERSRSNDADPLEALREGPLLRQELSDDLYEVERGRSQSF